MQACDAATSDTCNLSAASAVDELPESSNWILQGIGLTPLPDRCSLGACIRVRLQLYVRQGKGSAICCRAVFLRNTGFRRQSIHQSSWSQPLRLDKAKPPTEEKKAPQKLRA